MADQLYLNLWFPDFEERDILPKLLSVLDQFPFSDQKPGVACIGVWPVSFSEQPVLTEAFDLGSTAEAVLGMAAEFVHEDYAFELEGAWDLWVPIKEGELDETWQVRPTTVSFIAYGEEFDGQVYQQNGHIQINFGLDTPFILDDLEYTPEVERRILANIHKLVTFTQAVERECGIRGRVLWSESDGEENLASKLIARLQKVQ